MTTTSRIPKFEREPVVGDIGGAWSHQALGVFVILTLLLLGGLAFVIAGGAEAPAKRRAVQVLQRDEGPRIDEETDLYTGGDE